MKSRKDFTTKAEWLEYLKYYYAGLAMQGISAHPKLGSKYEGDIASLSVVQATALIEALNKEQ